MGGHALKKVITTRKNNEEYQKIKKAIIDLLQIENLKIDFPYEVPGKETFGDLDIIYQSEPTIDIREIVTRLFNPQEIVTNGDVLSFNYGDFQIDMIKCINLEFAKFYFSYGDFGAIVGRIVNNYGFKFGHEGFWVNVYTDENDNFDVRHSFGKIMLTTNPKELCTFLEIDYDRWEKLNSMEDIFDYIKSLKLFKPDIFEILNYDHNRRAKARPMYMKFLDYINVEIQRGGLHINENLQKEGIKYFNKEEEYNNLFVELRRKKEISEKFNGKILIELGVEQKKLGMIIKMFKEKYDEDWILNNTKEQILKELESIISELKSNFI